MLASQWKFDSSPKKNIMKIISMLFLAVLGFTALLPSASKSTIIGTVRDAELNDVVIGANIKIYQGNTLIKGTVTDLEGNYRVELESGTYDIELSYTGYQSESLKNITLEPGNITTCNFTLKAGQVLEEVVISQHQIPMKRKDEMSSYQTVTSEQIKNLPARSVNKVVGTLAGNTESAQIRGSRSDATNYYVDGARVLYNKTTPHTASVPYQAKPEVELKHKFPTGIPSEIGPDPRQTEQYNTIQENPFLATGKAPISTFSIDVDVASYANTRRFLEQGYMPPADAIRIEEMINYFDYTYPQPKSEHPFEVVTELGECPWKPNHQLLMVAMQGKEADFGQLPIANLVFLVDVSGSMSSIDKLPLVQQSLILLLEHLRPNDRIALVTYAGNVGLVLPSTPVSDKHKILNAIENLNAGGGTSGEAGIKLAYKTARENFNANGNNRVVLCTDGDFNVGVSSEKELVQLIENERESGVYLTVLGFGTGNYQDGKMQSLADAGNGNHAYIDGIKEAEKVLVKEIGGTLFTLAKDVKLQLEFNPAQVESYRLIGYENRILAKEDFDNDKKDAGELGSGHRVTALYEIVPAKSAHATTASSITFQKDDVMVLKLRYKRPKGNTASRLIEKHIALTDLGKTGDNFQLASTVAAFGMVMRKSPNRGNATWKSVHGWAEQAAKAIDPNGYRKELVRLIDLAEQADAMTAGSR